MEGAERPDTLLTWNAPARSSRACRTRPSSLRKPYRGGWMPAWVGGEASLTELTLASRPRASDFGMCLSLPRPSGLGHWGDEGLAKGAQPRIGRRRRASEAELRKVYFAMRLVVCAICRVLVPVSSLVLPVLSLTGLVPVEERASCEFARPARPCATKKSRA